MSQSGKYKSPSVDEPCPTVSCQSRIGVVKAKMGTIKTRKDHHMLSAYYGNGYSSSISEPCGTVTTKDRFSLVTTKFQSLMTYNSPGLNSPITDPCGTVTTKDRFALVTTNFIDQQYGNSKAASIDQPAGTITANPKLNLVNAQWLMDTQFKNTGSDLDSPCPTITANHKHFYLMNPQYSNTGGSIEKPCFTLIARMDKMPPYLIETKSGSVQITMHDTDTEIMKKLKMLCNDYGIIDIRMRMLLIEELLRIQGFGDTYKLNGTKADMKKFIGNAVECNQAKVLAEAIAGTLVGQMKEIA